MNKGSCLCGDIRWQIDGPVSMVVNCHCSMCRKAHGSAYAAFAVTAASDFEWLAGEDRIAVYKHAGEGGRNFCPHCGSIVAALMGDMAFMPIGNMEEKIDRPLDSHIFCGSKAAWHEITDSAPQFDEYPPEFARPATDIGERPPKTNGAVGGSCLCGAVAFEFDGPPDRMVNCHCSRCRRSRSALYATQVFVPAEQFRWLRGEDGIAEFKVPDAKAFAPAFCTSCSSVVPKIYERIAMAVIPAGTLDQDPGIRPEAHIFVTSKSPTLEIGDDLPQFDTYPPR